MKYLRVSILVLAGLSVVAGVVNTNSAKPTALCGAVSEKGLCNFPQEFFAGEGFNIAFETPVGSVACSEGYIEAETTEPPTPKGTTLKGTITPSEEYGLCTGKGGFCSVRSVNASYLAEITWTSGNNADVKFGNGGAGPPGVEISCSSTIDCTYTYESPLELQGGSSALLVASKDKLGSASGPICPGSGASITMTAKYAVGNVYAADFFATTTLCKKNETPCSAEQTYGTGTALSAGLEAGTAAKLKLKINEESEETEYTVPCGASTIEGETTASGEGPVIGTIKSITFGECGPTCSAKASKLSYASQIDAIGSGNGTMTMLAGTGSPRLRVRCIGAYKCTYESKSVSTSVTGGNPAKLSVSATLATKVTGESDEKCGSQLKWEGTYKFTKPEAGGEAKMWVVREGI